MSRAHFEKLKQELFERYEEQITALVECGVAGDDDHANGIAASANAQDKATRRPQDEIAGHHLRLSYPRQRLLCLRAARLRPAEMHPSRPEDATCTRTQGEPADCANTTPPRLSPFVFVKDSTEPPSRDVMHRLQEESVQQLRSAILDQARYRQERQQQQEGAAKTSAADDSKTTLQPEAMAAVKVERGKSLSIIHSGGVQGEAYLQQRLDILDQLERQLLEERVSRLAHDVCVA